MTPLARFVTRPSQPGDDECEPDIFVGVCMKDQSMLKPNTVYELEECFGEIVLKEVGKSWISERTWNMPIGNTMQAFGNKMVLTDIEAKENGVWDFWAGD